MNHLIRRHLNQVLICFNWLKIKIRFFFFNTNFICKMLILSFYVCWIISSLIYLCNNVKKVCIQEKIDVFVVGIMTIGTKTYMNILKGFTDVYALKLLGFREVMEALH